MTSLAKALALLLTIIVAAASGCMDANEPVAAAGEGEAPIVLTDPEDVAAAGMPGWHIHDYWDGENRLTAVDQEQSFGGWTCNGCDAIPLRFRGDAGRLVPLGTAVVDVTVEWQADGETRHGPPELWIKTAADREPERAGFVESGVPFLFNSTNAEADPPHQVLSRWEFWVMLPSLGGEAHFAGKVRVYAEAVRGHEIPSFPPHPDLWGGASEIPLLDAEVSPVIQRQNLDEGSRTCLSPCLQVHAPEDGRIVPYDAAAVVVTLTYDVGMPAGLGVRAHGGDTWEMTPAAGELAPPNQLVFRIPVTEKSGDSPYARQSLWEFEVFIDEPGPNRVFVGGYALRAVAVKA